MCNKASQLYVFVVLFLQTNYMKATETVTTLLSASMTERENGDLDSRTLGASNHTDRQETSVSGVLGINY